MKQILEGETFIAAGQQAIAHRGKVLTDEQTLGDAAVGEGDVVLLTRKGKSQSEASNQGIRREDRSQSQQTTFNRDGTATNPCTPFYNRFSFFLSMGTVQACAEDRS